MTGNLGKEAGLIKGNTRAGIRVKNRGEFKVTVVTRSPGSLCSGIIRVRIIRTLIISGSRKDRTKWNRLLLWNQSECIFLIED